MTRLTIGNLELCSLPELGIFGLEVRIDTGAKTSSLHVDNLKRFQEHGLPQVSFDLHPDIYNLEQVVHCSAPLHDLRRIKSSNGEVQQRCVIQTSFCLGEQTWPIEITLSNRQDMSYLMLLGREGMSDKVYVDPSACFLVNLVDEL